MSFIKSGISLIVYLVATAFIYLIGNLFNIEYLVFQKEIHHDDGSLMQATGSMLPFVLALPVFWIIPKRKER